MKTRQGLVSNSSSSSFIVCFSQDPTARENLERDMGDCYSYYSGWGSHVNMTVQQLLDRVHSDIMNTLPATKEDILKELAYDMPYDMQRNIKQGEDEAWEVYWARRDAAAQKYAEDRYEKNKEYFENNHVYILSYADDEGESELEHGNIFRNIPYVTSVSHH